MAQAVFYGSEIYHGAHFPSCQSPQVTGAHFLWSTVFCASQAANAVSLLLEVAAGAAADWRPGDAGARNRNQTCANFISH